MPRDFNYQFEWKNLKLADFSSLKSILEKPHHRRMGGKPLLYFHRISTYIANKKKETSFTCRKFGPPSARFPSWCRRPRSWGPGRRLFRSGGSRARSRPGHWKRSPDCSRRRRSPAESRWLWGSRPASFVFKGGVFGKWVDGRWGGGRGRRKKTELVSSKHLVEQKQQ